MTFPYLLRSDQLEALSHLRTHDHLLYIAPTGSGKSVVFQKYIHDHSGIRVLLISPLNALSRQLAGRFQKLGIPVHRQEPPRDQWGVWILSPEALQERRLETLRRWKPGFLVVDEAHCVWEWGRDFRPAYRKVVGLSGLPSIEKTMWCSATFPSSMRAELLRTFREEGQSSAKVFGKFELPKSLRLRSEKIPPEIRLSWLRNRLGLYADQSGLIFCNTRAAAEGVQKYLHGWGMNSFYYHAGLFTEEKLNLELQLNLQKQESRPLVVVATSAFGMGMDYPFFRFCILFEPPLSILALVQAVGRIGRNPGAGVNPTAQAHVLWHPADFGRHRQWADQSEVYEWCRTLGNPVSSLENYFNGAAVSGTIREDGQSGNHSYRPEIPDQACP